MGADTDTRTEREPLRKRIEGVIRDGLKAHRSGFENALVFDLADAVLAALAEVPDESDPIAQLRRVTALVCSVCQSVEYTDNAYALNRTHCSACTRKLYALPLVYRPKEERVPAAEEPQLTDYVLLEHENHNLWWPLRDGGDPVWSLAEAEAVVRSLAREGHRVRIVPLLRGTPVEIEGGSDGAQE